jgi:single-strand DNA-binding protein
VVNKVVLIGNLGRDPEVFHTQSGGAVARLSVATNEVWTKDGERQRRTEWHRVVVWGSRAERIAADLRKGALLYIEGRLRTQTFTNGDNVQQMRTHIDAQRLMRLERRRNAEPTVAPTEADGTRDSDDVPF